MKRSCSARETMADTKIIVVGAGPVGSLAALYAAKRGYQVEVYELRPGKSNYNFFSCIVSPTPPNSVWWCCCTHTVEIYIFPA
jgi:2-polyprenyl-6-methoxyphenol hydroxylase-like FAD-dependent oxidoreductase